MPAGAACPPRRPGDIATALVKQKRNPMGGSCSLKKYQCPRAHTGGLRALHQGASVLGDLALQVVQKGCSPEQMAVSTPLVNSPQCRRSLVLALGCLQGGLWGAGRKMGKEHLSGMVPLQNQGPGQASGKTHTHSPALKTHKGFSKPLSLRACCSPCFNSPSPSFHWNNVYRLLRTSAEPLQCIL